MVLRVQNARFWVVGYRISDLNFGTSALQEAHGVISRVLGHFQVGSYRYRSLIEGLYPL